MFSHLVFYRRCILKVLYSIKLPYKSRLLLTSDSRSRGAARP